MSATDTVDLTYRLQRAEFALDVSLAIPMQGITGIFGASGSGKTTLLRCIAGLEEVSDGELAVAGEHWQKTSVSRAVHEREIGYVFQEPRLFRHLDVRANIEYGMRRSAADDGADFSEVIDMLGLAKLLQRRPDELSGGEAQRVAIARALMRAPKFVLMDEPMAALDADRKNEILPFLERLHEKSSVPIVYVSHNIEEICRLCDHLVVLDNGRVVASGELQSVLVQLDLPQLGGEQAGSVIAGRIDSYDAKFQLTRVAFSGGTIWLPGRIGEVGDARRLRIRANDISLCTEQPSNTTVLNLLEVIIEEVQDTPAPTQLIRLVAGSERLIARITRRSREELNLQPGDKVVAQVKAAAVCRSENGELRK
jgi:molybdate transport system ATP-binding protein